MAPDKASFKTKVLKGFFWLSIGMFVGQFISWISTIIVIRLLLPKDYGLMAMASSVIALLMTFSELGISASIIQAERITEKEIRQIYGFIIASSLVVFITCHLAAPLAALFYREHDLVPIIRVMNINFLLIALYLVPQSLFIREMNFKSKSAIDVSAQIGSALVTLGLAWAGMGVWALVIGALALNLIKAVVFNVARAERFNPIFNFSGSENFISYGVTLTGSRLLYSLYNQADLIIVGRFLGQNAMGIYAVALHLASIPAEKVLPLINQISFTSYSRIQDDRERIRRNLLRTTRLIAFSGFPIFWGMAAVAPEGIPLILGPKWGNTVMPFQLLCIMLPLKALSPILASTLNAIGQAKVSLINTAIATIVLVVAFLIGVKNGIMGVCLAWVIVYPVVFLITSQYSLRVLGLPVRQYLAEISFPAAASLVMVGVIFLFKKILIYSPLSLLILLTLFGIVCYLGMTLIFKKDEYLEMKRLLQRERS
jgi:teichuronic acid exporter